MGKVSYGSSDKAEFWTAAMELFRQSGLSCVDFCNREGLAYSTFCRWRDKLSVASVKDESSGVGLEPSAEPESPSAGPSDVVEAEDVKFIPAGLVDIAVERTAGIEVRFSSGVSINVQKDFDRKVFKDVVAILGAELC